MNRIPQKHHGSKDEGYIYLAKIGKNILFCPNRNNVYKIGFTKGVEKRMQSLCKKEFVPIELIACGFTDMVYKTERFLHELFWRANYLFVFEEKYPRWSDEYFRFGQYHVIKTIEAMNILCKEVIIFTDPKPRWNTGETFFGIDPTTNKRVQIEAEFI